MILEPMTKTQPHERPYHHGDLRRAIVKAALEILSETQSLDFSLRELARRAGVSHNAPYKHFADKRELLSAVSAGGFEMLTKRMAREIGRHGNARERLFAMLRAYIDHGGGIADPASRNLDRPSIVTLIVCRREGRRTAAMSPSGPPSRTSRDVCFGARRLRPTLRASQTALILRCAHHARR